VKPPKVAMNTPPRPRTPRPPKPSAGGDDVFDSETKLGAGAGTVAAAAPAPAAGGGSCSVTLGSKPWAQVWIDGKNTNKVTPLVDYKVPCGKHAITFKNPEIPVEKTEQITVKAGEVLKKKVQLVDTAE
jgi:hypothetical protein